MVGEHEWRDKLAEAIRQYAKPRYRYLSQLRDELGIRDTIWKHIMAADMIAEDSEIYAVIFQRIGVSEANPREIPPRLKYHAKKKNYIQVPRAWSEAEYQDWLRRQEGKVEEAVKPVSRKTVTKIVQRPEPEKVPIEVPEPQVSVGPVVGQVLGNILDSWLEALGRQIGRVAAQEFKSLFVPGTPKNKDITALALALTALLRPYLEGGPVERDRLILEHGPAMGPLYSVLKLLVLSSAERESAIADQKRLEERFR